MAVHRLHVVGAVFSDNSHVTSNERYTSKNQIHEQPAAELGSGVYDEIDFDVVSKQSAGSKSNGVAINNDYDEIGDAGPENSNANTYLVLLPDKDCCEDDGHVTVL
jgi:hypothetical protein